VGKRRDLTPAPGSAATLKASAGALDVPVQALIGP
jgi:hypothetical protein